MTSDVGFVSVMHVSNETGAINDIEYIADYCKSINPKVLIHSDGVQAVGKIKVNLSETGVDMYTMSAHKIHGMKGVGALFVKHGVNIKPIIFGGGQEMGLRSGTENVLGIYSLCEAVKISCSNINENYNYVQKLKDRFVELIDSSGLKFVMNSSGDNSPYIVSISFVGVRAETLLNMLSDRGIYVGNGSACSSKNSGNRILENMGLDRARIEGNIRISFSKYNKLEEIDLFVSAIKECVLNYLSKV